MVRRIILAGGAAALAAAFLLSCTTATGPNDDDNIRGLVGGTYAAYFNDGQVLGGGSGGGNLLVPGLELDGQATLPISWWRVPTYWKRTIYITLEAPFTKADVIVKDDIRGTMYIDRSDNHTYDPGSKPFELWRTRYATFERDSTDTPWALTAISPAAYKMQDEGSQTVSTTSVRIVTAGGYDRTFTDGTELIPLDEHPTVTKGEKITVTVNAHNTSKAGWTPVSFAFLHHDWQRYNTNDQGNETYKGEYNITAEPGVRHNGVSVIDAGTLQNENDDDYDADGWSLPFRVNG